MKLRNLKGNMYTSTLILNLYVAIHNEKLEKSIYQFKFIKTYLLKLKKHLSINSDWADGYLPKRVDPNLLHHTYQHQLTYQLKLINTNLSTETYQLKLINSTRSKSHFLIQAQRMYYWEYITNY